MYQICSKHIVYCHKEFGKRGQKELSHEPVPNESPTAGTSRPKGLLQCIYGTHIPKSDVGNASSDLAKSAATDATDATRRTP